MTEPAATGLEFARWPLGRARTMLRPMTRSRHAPLAPVRRHGRRAQRGAGHRPRRGRVGLGRRRPALPRRHGEPLVLQRRPRPARDRRRGRRADGPAGGLLGVRRLLQRARARAGRAPGRAGARCATLACSSAPAAATAIDTAAKLARRYWQESGEPERDVLVVRTNAYHGTHGYGTSLAGIPANRIELGPARPGRLDRRARLGRRAARRGRARSAPTASPPSSSSR